MNLISMDPLELENEFSSTINAFIGKVKDVAKKISSGKNKLRGSRTFQTPINNNLLLAAIYLNAKNRFNTMSVRVHLKSSTIGLFRGTIVFTLVDQR